jgi:hypothetical protein
MIFNNQERKRSSPGRASRVWEGRRLVLARLHRRRDAATGRGQAVAPPIHEFPIVADFACENSLSGGAASQVGGPLPINRETTNYLTAFETPVIIVQ